MSTTLSRAPVLLDRLAELEPLVAAELRPPRADLGPQRSMDAWIDMHHAVGSLARKGRIAFVTDNAIGTAEEENLSHLEANLGEEVDPRRIVPFLTCKHTLDYCLVYAERAAALGFEALTVLGGDRSLGPPRCVPHAYQLRGLIRTRVPSLALGGWANPHCDVVEQVDYLARPDSTIDFFLTQVVSHHSAGQVESFVRELEGRDFEVPGVYGVFFYRSANPKTLARLSDFFPVPARELTRELEQGIAPEEVCARSVRALREAGARHVYVSNLGFKNPSTLLARIVERL